MDADFNPAPARVGTEVIRLKVADPAGRPVRGATVQLEGNMSHPGMSPVFGEAMETAPGIYEARLELSMAGDWTITAHFTLPSGKKIDRDISLRGVRAK